MKKITQRSTSIGSLSLLAVLVSIGLSSQVFAYTTIYSTLDFGENNSDVTSLQTFFADNSAIYPEGLVTGYFGGLTRSAVERFQVDKNIVSSGSAATTGYGRVGPTTLGTINNLIANGGWTIVATADVSGPRFYNVARSQNNTSATFSFVTSENTNARIVYNTSPLMFNEGDINSNGFAAIGGYAANSNNAMATTHTVSIINLQPNTVYYYTIIATDTLGNVSVVGPNNSFRTNAQ